MRVDIPTLKCDRCEHITRNSGEMDKYRSLTGRYDGYQGSHEKWDLCPECWSDYNAFIANTVDVKRREP